MCICGALERRLDNRVFENVTNTSDQDGHAQAESRGWMHAWRKIAKPLSPDSIENADALHRNVRIADDKVLRWNMTSLDLPLVS